MKIGFIGAGKVGFSLGKYFTEHNLCVSGYYSLNLDSAKEAATFTKTKYYKELKEIIKECDTLFLTVSDGYIREVYSKIIQSDIAGKYLVHFPLKFSVVSGRRGLKALLSIQFAPLVIS